MAGFEVVVRPVVIPNIRPAPARSLPPQDDPDKGFAVIRGNGAVQVSLSSSYSASASTSNRQETKRRVDEVRVYQKDDDGTVNKENFIDIEVTNKIWMEGPSQPTSDVGVGFGTPGVGSESAGTTRKEIEQWVFDREKEDDNKEIKKKDVIKTPSGLQQAR